MAKAVVITSPTKLVNDVPENGAANPWECHNFIHTVLYTEAANFISNSKWSLSGNVPVGLSIDPDTGIISGQISYFKDQPYATNNYPDEILLEDGSNYMNIGRFKDPSLVFPFTITREYNILNPLVEDPATPGALDPAVTDLGNGTVQLADGVTIAPMTVLESNFKDVEIKVIKNNDIDNLVYLVKYLEAGYHITVNGEKYFKDRVNELLQVHPGPFPNCTVQI